jgi:hypothetical protein
MEHHLDFWEKVMYFKIHGWYHYQYRTITLQNGTLIRYDINSAEFEFPNGKKFIYMTDEDKAYPLNGKGYYLDVDENEYNGTFKDGLFEGKIYIK